MNVVKKKRSTRKDRLEIHLVFSILEIVQRDLVANVSERGLFHT